MAPTKTPKTKPSLQKVKGENFYRNAKAVARVKLLSGASSRAIRDKDGKIIKAAAFQSGEEEAKPGRVQPDRRWFGNTRVISQTALDKFRDNLREKKDDPYSVLLKRNKLPMVLLDEKLNPNVKKRPHIVETEPFNDTFGPKAQRKKPRIDAGSFAELAAAAEEGALEQESKETGMDSVIEPLASSLIAAPTHADYHEPIYAKGTSRRIYGELYKVIDSSDVILHIIDARDPLGTLCESVLEFIKKEKAHKQVVLVINKCDLVPNWVTARYIKHLTPRYPTIAFHASPNHSFGKGSLIQLLRQFSQLHSDKKQISVGFIGYPNVGKSSVINTLKSGKVCRVAPVPGETKVWQYITLTKRIYLIDCPGIVPTSAHDTETSTVLKGVVRVEALPTPSDHISTLLERVKSVYISRTYGIPLPESGEFDADDLMDALARMKGRLLKGGQPDVNAVAKIMLSDWVRGRIPYFVPPPERSEELNAKEEKEKAVKAKEAKRKEKRKEKEMVVEGVTQNLGSIMQKNTFVPEDVRPLDVEFTQAPEEENASVPEEDVSDKAEDEEEEELTWNDVFNGVDIGPTGLEDDDAPAVGDDDEDNEDDDRDTKDKSARMKTNKRKATNFYSNANVKNKNRSKAAVLKSLSGGGGEGRKRKK